MGSTKRHLLVGVLAFVLGNVGWLIFIYMPKQAELGQLRGKIKELTVQVQGLVAQERQITAAQAEIDSTRQKIARIERRIYPKGELVSMVNSIERRGALYGLRFTSIMPDYDALLRVDARLRDELGPLVILPVEFTVQGKFIDFGRFVESVDSLPFAFSISKVHLEATTESYPQVIARLEGVFYLTESPQTAILSAGSPAGKVSGPALPSGEKAMEGASRAKT